MNFNIIVQWKGFNFPLGATVSSSIWRIYVLIPSTWNNLEELNLLITHQSASAKPALTTAVLQHRTHPMTSLVTLFTCSWPPLDWSKFWPGFTELLSLLFFCLCADRWTFVSHGALEDEVHPAKAGASGPGPVAAVLAGSDVWGLCLLSGGLS